MIFDRAFRPLKGNIALTVVILAGAILLTSGLSILASAIDISLASKAYISRTMADLRLTTCIEESMYNIAKLPTFTGTFTMTYADGNCTSVVTSDITNSNYKKLELSATVASYSVTRVKYARIDTSPVQLTNELPQ